jgi:hypothetical protein
MKYTFLALQDSVCGSCNTSPPCNPCPQLCPSCSDPYTSGLNGDQNSIGSRAWVNPFTGSFPSTANNHSGHSHNGVSHRILVEASDLIPAQNPGASYFGEAAYISPHELPGASRIRRNATCLTIIRIVSSQLPAGLPFRLSSGQFHGTNANCHPSVNSYERHSQSD